MSAWRPRLGLVGGGVLLLVAAGCATVDMERFATATRIDAMLNPGTAEFPEPFASEVARLRPTRRAVCTDPNALAKVQAMLGRWQFGWMEYWFESPGTAPVVLIFHNNDQWLGTLQLYPSALGQPHNLVRRITREEAADLLRLILGG